jgi:tetratricopeptide (TPR) repeat protein
MSEAFEMAVQHHRGGRQPQAEQLYLRILQVDPWNARTLHFLGLLAHQTGRGNLAIEYIRQAVRIRPDYAEAHSNLGMVLAVQEKLAEAVVSYEEALRLKPDLAETHNNLANLLRHQGKLEQAVASYQKALHIKPRYAEAYCNLGLVLLEQGRLTEAEASQKNAICIDPTIAEARLNLGVIYAEQGKLTEAAECYEEALRLRPNYAQAFNNLGVVHAVQGRYTEAAGCYEQALCLNPDDADAHLNLAYSWFFRGDFEAAWPEYEWRWKRRGFSQPSFGQPTWDGTSIHGQTILVFAEQGMGDTLQFIRYAPLVKCLGARVLVQCQGPLLRLLATCRGIDRLVREGNPLPHFDVQVPLLSLPRIFGSNLTNIPATIPYLHVDRELCSHWQRELSSHEVFKVGIAWQGSPEHQRDRRRSVHLRKFEPLAGVPGVRLVSLQKGPGRDQLPLMVDRLNILDTADRLDDFADTAALLVNLDLVITVDTAVAHLAGALGIPVWVVLPFDADWRWLLDREDTPWYPTMRLFRQTTWGDWAGVFERVTAALQEQAEVVWGNRAEDTVCLQA